MGYEDSVELLLGGEFLWDVLNSVLVNYFGGLRTCGGI